MSRQADVAPNTARVESADCPFPKHAIAGGFSGLSFDIIESQPSGDLKGWTVEVQNTDWFNAHSLVVYAVCV